MQNLILTRPISEELVVKCPACKATLDKSDSVENGVEDRFRCSNCNSMVVPKFTHLEFFLAILFVFPIFEVAARLVVEVSMGIAEVEGTIGGYSIGVVASNVAALIGAAIAFWLMWGYKVEPPDVR